MTRGNDLPDLPVQLAGRSGLGGAGGGRGRARVPAGFCPRPLGARAGQAGHAAAGALRILRRAGAAPPDATARDRGSAAAGGLEASASHGLAHRSSCLEVLGQIRSGSRHTIRRAPHGLQTKSGCAQYGNRCALERGAASCGNESRSDRQCPASQLLEKARHVYATIKPCSDPGHLARRRPTVVGSGGLEDQEIRRPPGVGCAGAAGDSRRSAQPGRPAGSEPGSSRLARALTNPADVVGRRNSAQAAAPRGTDGAVKRRTPKRDPGP